MNDQVFEIGRQQYDHTGGEMALNPNIPSELFRIIFMGIEFSNPSVKSIFSSKYVKTELLDLISSYSQRFEKYNPYAYALGFVLQSTSDKDKGTALVLSILNNKKETDYYGVPINEITTFIDVIRYSRLVNRLQAAKKAIGIQEIVYTREENDDEYDENENEYDGYEGGGLNSDGEEEF
jgi:hypothetical protein